ncbi:hypothetical protein K470DRAFT_297145 [Piedraia hortae CBS 480.64]|uniref:DNA polymerase delta subunit 4 n=1 Tax=Piedraia hortae CBS 480.64 TaxID=1314780 RepID=A0A6A7BQI0_9PEZI|nr:hypothetical protein K470DRAFT_297145 [Piedraia hortae CBS 480.64]
MPKRNAPAGTAHSHSHQSQLSFHGRSATNKVTKSGVNAAAIDRKKAELPKPVVPVTVAAYDVEKSDHEEEDENEESLGPWNKVTEQQINDYWSARENSRIAPRVHQNGLSRDEKILREWDLSTHYGPCIGISRKRRWCRANGLGLDPAIEVLAVIMREDKKNTGRAYIDDLLTARTGLVE